MSSCIYYIKYMLFQLCTNCFLFSGIDMAFLKTALAMAEDSVYSLHKTATREVTTLFF